jgi:hypothetical protein
MTVSPISAYSIEIAHGGNNFDWDIDVLVPVDSIGSIPSNENINKEKSLEFGTSNNETYENPLGIPRIVEVFGVFISMMGTLTAMVGINNPNVIVFGLATPFNLGFTIVIIGMFISAIGGD